MNLLGHVKSENRGYDVCPTTSVDCLVFCWLPFFDYSLLESPLPLRIDSIMKEEAFQGKGPYGDSFYPMRSLRFMRSLAASPRFQSAMLLDYKKVFDASKNLQFSAVSIKFGDDIVVAFGGTDPSFVGWKEDFMLSYKDDIASYPLAKEFLEKTMNDYKENIILCGYSKGGNVASNTLLTCDHPRIVKAYSFDGPGFRDEVLDLRKNETSLEKLVKFIPDSSLVGIIFSNEKEASFIRSKLPPVMQHDPFSWVIKDGDFVYLSKRTISSSYLERAFNGWVDSLNKEERERFTEIAFGALDGLKVKDIISFGKTFLLQVGPMLNAYRHLDKEDRRFFNSVITRLIKNFLKPKKG